MSRLSTRKRVLYIITLFLLCQQPLFSQPKIIFDTDFGGDADDLGALVMLHNFVDRGECELLAVMCWNLEQDAVAAIDAVNRFYHHPDMLIGTRKGETFQESWNYTGPIAKSFDYRKTYADVADATMLYRQILAQQADTSITIVTVGPLMNIKNLLTSSADSISTLSGKELINKKVKEFVVMGGQFPSGDNEWNFGGDMPGVTKFVLENLTVPITFSGFEVGNSIKTGKVFNTIDKHQPLYIGFMHFSQNAPWIKDQYKGEILNNSTYDQTAVLYAVRNGVGLYWEKVSDGFCQADSTGGNHWISNGAGNHSYLKLTYPTDDLARIIESFMLNDF